MYEVPFSTFSAGCTSDQADASGEGLFVRQNGVYSKRVLGIQRTPTARGGLSPVGALRLCGEYLLVVIARGGNF